MKAVGSENNFSTLLQDFFRQRLLEERNASLQTVASYRDTFRMFLLFIQTDTGKSPGSFRLEDLDMPLVLRFLEHIENVRGNSVRTRNVRLAAIRSFVRYVSLREPAWLPNAQRILAIPTKRFDRPLVNFLTREEIETIIQAPDRSTWGGHRDQVMLATFYNTGARVSEVTRLSVDDVFLNGQAYIRFQGKGRKERTTPMWKSTAKRFKEWFSRIDKKTGSPLFPNRNGQHLTRSGVENRLRVAVRRAVPSCPSLRDKKISPHTLRHTTAMHMLQAGVDITTIALWLGHENPSTTHLYIEADLAMKERALQKLNEVPLEKTRYQPKGHLLAFLESL
jgi:integrase/recombinase XerD